VSHKLQVGECFVSEGKGGGAAEQASALVCAQKAQKSGRKGGAATHLTRWPSRMQADCSSGSNALSVSGTDAPLVGACSDTNNALMLCLLRKE
jgi:hypothetical protein